MKNFVLLFFAGLFAFSAKSQLKIEYSAGYGDYKMNDMKAELNAIQSDLKQQYPVDIGITDLFPAYVTHHIGATYLLTRHEAGIGFTYLTTAGKLAYSDYSAQLMNKLTLNAYRIGLLYRYHFYQLTVSNTIRLSFYGEVSPGLTFTRLKTKGYIRVGNELENLDDKYLINRNTKGFSALPQAGVNLKLPYGLGIEVPPKSWTG